MKLSGFFQSLADSMARFFSLKTLKIIRTVSLVMLILGLIPDPLPLLDELFFLVLFATSSLLVRSKRRMDPQPKQSRQLQREIEAYIKKIRKEIKSLPLLDKDSEVQDKLQVMEESVLHNLALVKDIDSKRKDIDFAPALYNRSKRKLERQLTRARSPGVRKNIRLSLTNLDDLKRSYEHLLTKRKELLSACDTSLFQLKALHSRLVQMEISAGSRNNEKQLDQEMDDIISTVKDLTQARRETQQLLDAIKEPE